MTIGNVQRGSAYESWASEPEATFGLTMMAAAGLARALVGPAAEAFGIDAEGAPDVGLLIAFGRARIGDEPGHDFAFASVVTGAPAWAVGLDPGADVAGVPFQLGDPASPALALLERHGFTVAPAIVTAKLGKDRRSASFSIEGAEGRIEAEGEFPDPATTWESRATHWYGCDPGRRARWSANQAALRRIGTVRIRATPAGRPPVAFEAAAALDVDFSWRFVLDPVAAD
jgi:hypothetical protein